ncbi:MAG: YciI family protein [Rhizobiaceae bacterium]
MPLWNEYKEIARERGSLAFELFVVESTPAVGPDIMKEALPRHLAYQKEMEAAGKLFLAGPMSDDTGEQMMGAGLIIYRAESMDQARDIARQDPMHAEGCRTFTLRKWLVNEGSPSFETRLSDKKVILK